VGALAYAWCFAPLAELDAVRRWAFLGEADRLPLLLQRRLVALNK